MIYNFSITFNKKQGNYRYERFANISVAAPPESEAWAEQQARNRFVENMPGSVEVTRVTLVSQSGDNHGTDHAAASHPTGSTTSAV